MYVLIFSPSNVILLHYVYSLNSASAIPDDECVGIILGTNLTIFEINE